MAWFESISTSLKGQISNLAKGVFEDEIDSEGNKDNGDGTASNLNSPSTSNDNRPSTSQWNEELVVTDTFVGQSAPSSPRINEGHTPHKDAHNTQPETEETSLIASILSLGKGSDSEEQIAALQEENRNLRQDNESKANEIRSYTRIIHELQSQVAVSQDENSNLSTGMEELDIQHQQAIEEVLSVKEETHKQLEALQKAYADLEESHRSLTHDEQRRENNQSELQKLQEENANLIKELEKAKKLANQNENLMRELEERDRELEELEGVNITLRSDIEMLRSEEENNGSLPTIHENNEEIEALEHRINALEIESTILREVRSNLETEVSNSGIKIEELNQRLQISEGSVRNQENLLIEIDNLNRAKQKMEKDAQDKNKYIKELESELEKSKKETDDLKNVISKKEKDKELSWYENQSKEECLSQENLALKYKLKQLESQAKEVDKELERLQKENETKQNKMCEMMFEMNTISDDLKQATQKESDLKLQIKELELKLDSSQDHEVEVSQEVNKLTQLKEELVILTQENVKLQEQLNTKTSQIEELIQKNNTENEHYIQEKTAFEMEIELLKNISNEFQIYKDIQKQKDSEFKRQLELKEEELNKIKASMEEKEFSLNEQFTATVSDFEIKITQQETELNNLRTIDSNRAQMEQNLKSEIENLKIMLEKNKEEFEKREKLISENVASKYQEQEKQIIQQLTDRITEQDKQMEITLKNYTDTKSNFENLQEKLNSVEKELQSQISDNKELLKRIQIKEVFATGLASEVEQLKLVVKQEKENGEKLKTSISEIKSAKDKIENQLKEKESYIEQVDGGKSKEITTLKQEVESLKNQLEYATQLMHVAERQEAEGRGVTPPPPQACKNGCHETQEELNRITTALLKEQTENKLLVNEVTELKEANAKLNTKLSRLQSHLVEIESYYTSIEVSSRERIAELEAKQALVDDWVKSSSTAYTSANIRANQQVESLTQQVKLLTEHKEKLEAQISHTEDEAQKQLAAVTNLQAVLNQFQKDKQRDIELETDRIKQKLSQSFKTNEELCLQIKDLQEQLSETKKGLVAATRLSEQLDLKEEQIISLKKEVTELHKKLNSAEEKLQNINSTFEGKIDRNLMKNLLVGYISSGPKYKEQALRVISQVLELSKEERQRVGLDSDGNSEQVSLSEAFIRFLETESQPKQQVFVPLSQPPSTTPSRKTSQSSGSILMDENINLPNFTIGRNAGSILKDVLNDRNT